MKGMSKFFSIMGEKDCICVALGLSRNDYGIKDL